MSEEELNQELSTDELKDVAGGISLPTQPTSNKAFGVMKTKHDTAQSQGQRKADSFEASTGFDPGKMA